MPEKLPPFGRALTTQVAWPLIALGVALLIALLVQGIASSDQAARRDITQAVDRSAERLQLMVGAAELTAESAWRAMRTQGITGTSLRPALENLLAAFEQRPELSYIGVALAETGEYGTLERTADGQILLWLFPDTRLKDPVARNFVLTDGGFEPFEQRSTQGYDPRARPFFEAGANSDVAGTWMPSYQWVVHTTRDTTLWGITFVKPLHDEAGLLRGVLDTDLDLPALNRFLRSVGREYKMNLQLVELGAAPQLIGALNVTNHPLPMPPELQAFVAAPGAASAATVEVDGKRRWAAARKLEFRGMSWVLVATSTQPFVPGPLRSQMYLLISAGLVTALIIVLLSLRLARRMARPLMQLEQRVASLERGEPVPAEPLVCDYRETRRLDQALTRMATAVRGREQELRTQNARLRSHMENTPLAVLEWSAQRITSVNASAMTLFHRRAAEMLGQPLLSLVAPADHELVIGQLDRTRSRTQEKQFIARALTGDGRTPQCEWYVTRLEPDENGEVRTSALVLDISALRGNRPD